MFYIKTKKKSKSMSENKIKWLFSTTKTKYFLNLQNLVEKKLLNK